VERRISIYLTGSDKPILSGALVTMRRNYLLEGHLLEVKAVSLPERNSMGGWIFWCYKGAAVHKG
jgi:hypothetical protein